MLIEVSCIKHIYKRITDFMRLYTTLPNNLSNERIKPLTPESLRAHVNQVCVIICTSSLFFKFKFLKFI